MVIEGDPIRVPRFEKNKGFKASEKSSAAMRRIASENTKAEVKLRKVLWRRGYRYRLHVKRLPGKPDIIFIKQRLVIFVDGDFWHGYDWERKKVKLSTNIAYWVPKIERNMQHDIEITVKLTDNGWEVLRFWEHEIEKNVEHCVKKIIQYLDQYGPLLIKNPIFFRWFPGIKLSNSDNGVL